MIPTLSLVILVLVACCLTLWLMLIAAARDIEALEDFIVELDDGIDGAVNPLVMPTELRADLAQEAEDIRESRKEEGDE